MKTTFNIALLALMATFSGACQTQIPDELPAQELTYTEVTATRSEYTKTTLNGSSVLWDAEGETISLIGEDGTGYPFTQKSVSSDRKTATFGGSIPSGSINYAVYPSAGYVSSTGSRVTMSIPVTQTATAGSFATGTAPCIATFTSGEPLHFRNAAGLLGFTVNATGIKSIRFSATRADGGSITGPVIIDYSGQDPVCTSSGAADNNYVEITGDIQSGTTYWAVAAPGTYSGLKVVFTNADGKTATFTKDGPLTIPRGKRLNISAFTISEWDGEEETQTATLTYAEASGSVSGYSTTSQYTNAYGTWEIRAYNTNSAMQLNSGSKTSWIGTPEFAGTIKSITINNVGTATDATLYACLEAGGTSSVPTPNASVPVTGKGDFTLDVSKLDAKRIFLRSNKVVQITSVTVIWGGSGSGSGGQQGPRVSVTTGSASAVTTISATISGSWSGATATVREAGFHIGTDASNLDEVYQADITPAASGNFSVNLDLLDPNVKYFYRAYVILQDGSDMPEFTGSVASFTTQAQQDVPPAGSQPSWAELPLMNISNSGNYMINSKNSTEYYAWHICPDFYIYHPNKKAARNYTVCFSSTYHCPVWVAAPRHRSYETGSGRSSYSKDPDIPADIQYKGTDTGGGCNKGHMLGSAERTVTNATNKQVFYYTNIAPQLSSGFNTGGGGWNTLEDKIDDYVCSDTLYVVIGCYFKQFTDGYGKSASPKTISFGGRSDVAMPTMFYYAALRTKDGESGKSVKDCTADELQCVAFVRTHTNDLKGQDVTSKELMSITDLEAITGVTYFANVPNAPKNTFNAKDWNL